MDCGDAVPGVRRQRAERGCVMAPNPFHKALKVYEAVGRVKAWRMVTAHRPPDDFPKIFCAALGHTTDGVVVAEEEGMIGECARCGELVIEVFGR